MSSGAINANNGCDGGSDGGGGGKRKRTEIGLQNSDDNDDTNDALLERENERLKAIQMELALAEKRVENIRQQIRSNGRYEADSLLRLSDGGDEHILAHMMCFLDVEDVVRCAMVCNVLNNQAAKCWEAIDARLLSHDSLRSPSAQSSRERVSWSFRGR